MFKVQAVHAPRAAPMRVHAAHYNPAVQVRGTDPDG